MTDEKKKEDNSTIDWLNNKVYLDEEKTIELIDGWFRYGAAIYNINPENGISQYFGSYKDLIKKITYKGKWVSNWFSNMKPLDVPFYYQGIQFTTVENFYQAMKLPKDKIELRKQIAYMTPQKAKQAIRDKVKFPWREDWTKEESLKVMEYALRIKFAKGTSWHSQLKTTYGEIVEWNNWGDKFWGKTLDGEGENHLGKLLMKIRDE